MNTKSKLVEIFSSIDNQSWELIITKRPFTEAMKKISGNWELGKFAVLSLTLGLNNFQTKGKAEKGYWPPVKDMIEKRDGQSLKLPELEHTLSKFFSTERFARMKELRLHKFMKSDMSKRLWDINDQEYFVREFRELHLELAQTMGQQKSKKTIVFAMKCLGMTLFMEGRRDFDFHGIDIPVDSRVESFYNYIGLQFNSHQEIQGFSREILDDLQKNGSDQVNMMHLDSLIWDISNLQPDERKRYYDTRKFQNKVKLGFETLLAHW